MTFVFVGESNVSSYVCISEHVKGTTISMLITACTISN